MLHMASNSTAGWLAEIPGFALRSGHDFDGLNGGGAQPCVCLLPVPGSCGTLSCGGPESHLLETSDSKRIVTANENTRVVYTT